MIECMETQSIFKPYCPDSTAEMLGMDKDSVVSIANEYLSCIDEDLDELQRAIQENDYERIAFASHKIKGVAANLGMEHVSSMASHINTHAKKTIEIDYNLYYTTLERVIKITNNQLQTKTRN